MYEPTLKEELVTLDRYAWNASTALALAGDSYWEALWSDQKRGEKYRLEDSVNNLRLHRDKYLQEIQKTSTYLSEIKDALSPSSFMDL